MKLQSVHYKYLAVKRFKGFTAVFPTANCVFSGCQSSVSMKIFSNSRAPIGSC